MNSARVLLSTLMLSLSALMAGGCFDTPKATCAFACGASDECPSGYYCAQDSWCKSEGTAQDYDCGAVLVDGSTPDASTVDAGVDASAPDSGPDASTVVCGDKMVTGTETCDDGNQIDDGNGCDALCQRNDVCGDGNIQSIFESCDDGNEVDDGNGCSDACVRNNVCGNTIVEALFEACDDGNEVDDGNGCSQTCEANNTCGDGTLEDQIEQCDDGNTTDDGNGCDTACQQNNTCGDGTLEDLFEVCDDNNIDACGTCSAACDVAQGATPNDCADGVGCVVNGDCLSDNCVAGTCAAI